MSTSTTSKPLFPTDEQTLESAAEFVVNGNIAVLCSHFTACFVLLLALYSLSGSRAHSPQVKKLVFVTLTTNLSLSAGFVLLACLQINNAGRWQDAIDDYLSRGESSIDPLIDIQRTFLNKRDTWFTLCFGCLIGGFVASGLSESMFLYIIRKALREGASEPPASDVRWNRILGVTGYLVGFLGCIGTGFLKCSRTNFNPCFRNVYVAWYYALFCLMALVILPLVAATEIALRRARRKIFAMQCNEEQSPEASLFDTQGGIDERTMQLIQAQDRTLLELVTPLRGYPLTYISLAICFIV